MTAIGTASLFQTNMPDELNLHLLSFLEEKRDLQSIACTCKLLDDLSKDYTIWKPKTEIEFGKIIANGAREYTKSWKQTYKELCESRQVRLENKAEVLEAVIKKITINDLQYKTEKVAAAMFGFPMPNPDAHYYPTGQTGTLGPYKIKVFKSDQL